MKTTKECFNMELYVETLDAIREFLELIDISIYGQALLNASEGV